MEAAGLSPGDSLTGRVRLYISRSNATLPIESDSDGAETVQVFGVDVKDLGPGDVALIDQTTLGYPRESLTDLDYNTTYYIQAELVL